jgi:hypothetical protein
MVGGRGMAGRPALAAVTFGGGRRGRSRGRGRLRNGGGADAAAPHDRLRIGAAHRVQAKLTTPRGPCAGPACRATRRSSGPPTHSAAKDWLNRAGRAARCGAIAQRSLAYYRVRQQSVSPPLRQQDRILRITCEFRRFSGHPSESVRRSSSGELVGVSYARHDSLGVCTWLRSPSLATMISKYT